METLAKTQISTCELAEKIGWDQVSMLKLEDELIEENISNINLYSQFLFGHISPYIFDKFGYGLTPYSTSEFNYLLLLEFIQITSVITYRKIDEKDFKITLHLKSKDCNYVLVLLENSLIVHVASECNKEQDIINISYKELTDMFVDSSTTGAILYFLKEII